MDEKDELLTILDELSKGSKFLWTIFVLTLTPTIFNGMHSMSYVFTTEVPPHRCAVPQLTAANWSELQIVRVSSADSCRLYDYNYTYFAQVGYELASEYIEANRTADTWACSEYSYENTGGSTVVEEVSSKGVSEGGNRVREWNVSVEFGVRQGGGSRQHLHGPVPRQARGRRLLRRFRRSSRTQDDLRDRHIYADNSRCDDRLGTLVLGFLATEIRHGSELVRRRILVHDDPFMPESPRWLLSQNRRKEAYRVTRRYYEPLRKTVARDSFAPGTRDVRGTDETSGGADNRGCVPSNLQSLKIIFSHVDLRRRAFVMYFSWMTSSLCYYAIALNVDNFSLDHYTYILVMGLTEIPAYLVPSAILMIMGRRQAGALLYTIGGVCLLCVLVVPRENTVAIMSVALTGRFALSAVYGIVILYTSELFPTVVRNSAIGTSSVMAHVGTITAPYIADLVGKTSWWAPSTLCGVLALIAGACCLVLPETRNSTLADTLEEETAKGRGAVSLSKLCSN